MNSGEYQYIWQQADWPAWRFDASALAESLVKVSRNQGMLLGRMVDAGLLLRDQATLLALSEEVLKTSAIEGEHFEPASVRSSIARRMGLDIGALAPKDRYAEGVVDMVLDATEHYADSLSAERLLSWHYALFPDGQNGLTPIRVGQWRDDANGAMQVVSGPLHRQRVHFEAPPATQLPAELERFLQWINGDSKQNALLKAGLAHLWFLTLHPFDDGNGRIARAIGEMLLARADGSAQRFYSLSAQIQRERRAYYEILERIQKGGLDVTEWLAWFLQQLDSAINNAQQLLDSVLFKACFWRHWSETPLNARHIKVLNRLIDGFDGKLTSSKWAALAKCSADTALRDINELLALGVLQKAEAGGRSSAYALTRPWLD
ncbi:MAG: Fic family protein [Arenimonas sp.]|nr:Fic family protein [Arenimonas sp.]